MDERRKLPRKYLMVYSRVFDRRNGRIIGYLSDLNQLGAMTISDDPLPIDTVLDLRFDLPDPIVFPIDHLNISARVAWCQADINPAFYNVGFEFLNVGAKETDIIEQMIVTYEFRRDANKYPPSISSFLNPDDQ
jgi:hypothetical protein